ncbi:MAG: GNAT family N-acetyltransferase, partial [Burkholderiales bacterium]|nr:GNAT family N-acetyltransferase [Burkholderiales bacterium]
IMRLNDELDEDKWSQEQYERVLECELSIDLYIIDEEVVGFIVYAISFDELKILSFVIAKCYQRRYIGSKLMFHTLNKSRQIEGVIYAMLDVCVFNSSAINLYHQFGFRILCIREDYYNDRFTRDGYLMQLKLSKLEPN